MKNNDDQLQITVVVVCFSVESVHVGVYVNKIVYINLKTKRNKHEHKLLIHITFSGLRKKIEKK